MKIASNTPASFYPNEDFKFVQLGDELSDVSMIVLMLGRNWSVANVDKIEALTYWISSYPKHTPCYIIGCEVTFPDMEFRRYRSEQRDRAIRALCDEVLVRSKSIGVRGRITYEYLTKVIGYDQSQIDIIYCAKISSSIDKLRTFYKKNNCPIELLENDILRFQSNPRVTYERPITSEKAIIISQPYITTTGSSVRLNAVTRMDGCEEVLWCETSNIYREYLLNERVDAFLCVLLPLAMRAGKDIICEAPVSEQFLHNLTEILIPNLCAHDHRLYSSQIIADGDSSPLDCGNVVATGMSCGVDSFYTVYLYKNTKFDSMRLTHLYCGNYLYGNDGAVYERAELVAKDLQLPLIRTATNINERLRGIKHVSVHFFKTMFGVLALRKLFRIYLYSSSGDFSNFKLKGNSTLGNTEIELLLLYVFSCVDFQVVSGGGKGHRLEKTRSIGAMLAAQEYLNVCAHANDERNCGKCAKCMRTLLMLDMLGSLDLFQKVFNIDEYYQNRLDSFMYLIEQKNSPMLSKVHKHFLESEPMMMAEAARRVLR